MAVQPRRKRKSRPTWRLCEQCAKPFSVEFPSRPQKFCSRHCSGLAKSAQRPRDEHGTFLKGMTA